MWTEQGLDTFRDKHLDRNKNIAKMVHVKTDLYNKICLYGKIAYLWTKHGDLPWIQLDTFLLQARLDLIQFAAKIYWGNEWGKKKIS